MLIVIFYVNYIICINKYQVIFVKSFINVSLRYACKKKTHPVAKGRF